MMSTVWSMKSRGLWIAVSGVVAWFALIACWFIVVKNSYTRLDPEKQGVSTFQQYLERMPEPERLNVVRHEGMEYMRVLGPDMTVIAAPSGSSAYVFDRKGQLVDWTSDFGDDSRFAEKWVIGHGVRPRLTPEDALKWFDANK